MNILRLWHSKVINFMMAVMVFRSVSPSNRRCRRCRSRCRCRCPFRIFRRIRRLLLVRLSLRPRCRLSWSCLAGRWRRRRATNDRLAPALRRRRWSALIGRPVNSILSCGGFSCASRGSTGTSKTHNATAPRVPVPIVCCLRAAGDKLPLLCCTIARNAATSYSDVPRVYALCLGWFGVQTAFPTRVEKQDVTAKRD